MKYEFEKNLLELSHSKELETATFEWVLVEKTKEKESRNCICQHKIFNINFFYNRETDHLIMVGNCCSKKLKLNTNAPIREDKFKDAFNKWRNKGEYGVIDDTTEYSEFVKHELIQYFLDKTKSNSITYLRHLLDQLIYLQLIYGLRFLKSIHDDIQYKIDFILKKQEEYERIAREIREEEERLARIKKEEDERLANEERKKNQQEIALKEKEERIKHQQEMARKKEEQEQKNKILREKMELEIMYALEEEKIRQERQAYELLECKCGIKKKNICCCDNPKYEMVRLSENLFCKACNKWKCRCNSSCL